MPVSIGPGGIQNLGGEAFAGTSWSYTLVARNLDSDNHSVNGGLEVALPLTGPTNPDTAGDG